MRFTDLEAHELGPKGPLTLHMTDGRSLTVPAPQDARSRNWIRQHLDDHRGGTARLTQPPATRPCAHAIDKASIKLPHKRIGTTPVVFWASATLLGIPVVEVVTNRSLSALLGFGVAVIGVPLLVHATLEQGGLSWTAHRLTWRVSGLESHMPWSAIQSIVHDDSWLEIVTNETTLRFDLRVAEPSQARGLGLALVETWVAQRQASAPTVTSQNARKRLEALTDKG